MKIDNTIRMWNAFVTDISVTAGFGGNNSSCNISLVEPIVRLTENTPLAKSYVKEEFAEDVNAYEQAGGTWIGKPEFKEEVKFAPPSLGTLYQLKIERPENLEKFVFNGVAQRWGSSTSTGGAKYSVELASPATFLDGVHIILDKFQGTIYISDNQIDQPDLKPNLTYDQYTYNDFFNLIVKSPSNIINLFAFKENYKRGGRVISSLDPTAGTVGGIFGAADRNELGYPVKGIIDDIHACCEAGVFGGLLTFGGTKYRLDLSGLKEAVSTLGDYRISETPNISLNAFIERIASLTNNDYYIYVDEDPKYPPDPATKAMSYGIIKVRLISKKQLPNPIFIHDTIAEMAKKPDKFKDVISWNYGRELASDVVTQKILLGDNATRHWFADDRYILPIWGQRGNEEAATYYYGASLNDYYYMFAPVRIVVDAFDLAKDAGSNVKYGDFVTVDTNLLELRCALGGKESWLMYHKLFYILSVEKPLKAAALNYKSPLKVLANLASFNLSDIKDIFDGNKTSGDLFDTSIDNAKVYASYMFGTKDSQKDYVQRYINTRFNCIQKIASTFYGRQYLVAMPSEPGGLQNNFRWINFQQKGENSWDISGSAWAGDDIGNYVKDISFYEKFGSLKSLVVYPVYDNYRIKKVKYTPEGPVASNSDGILADYNELGSNYSLGLYYNRKTKRNENCVMTPTDGIDTNWGTNGIVWLDITRMRPQPKEIIPQQVRTPVYPTDSFNRPIDINVWYAFAKVSVKPVWYYDEYTTQVNGFGVLAKLILGDDSGIGNKSTVGYQNMFGSENIDCPIHPAALPPAMITVPQKSNRYVWGPWWGFANWNNQNGPTSTTYGGEHDTIVPFYDKTNPYIEDGAKSVGKLDITVENDFAPENFGSIAAMNSTANYIVASDLAKLYNVEKGNIEIAEFPKYNLTDQLFQFGPYITDMSINISSSQITTSYTFSTWSKRNGDLAKYNKDRILKAQTNNFNTLSQINRLFNKKLPPPPVNKQLLASFEQNAIKAIKAQANNAIVGNFMNRIYKNVYGPKPGQSGYADSLSDVNTTATTTNLAMKSAGYAPEESFMSSTDMFYSPAYIFDQRSEDHKEDWNKKIYKV